MLKSMEIIGANKMQEYINRANILTEALPYIKKFKGITVVIKYGGSALVDEQIKNTIIKDIALMKLVGFKPVIVHGGGPEINSALKKMNVQTQFINGLRVTNEQTMEVVEMVLSGKINKQITTELSMEGVQAVGISGKDGGMLKAEKLLVDDVDLGLVGRIVDIDIKLIKTLIDNDFIPVISPVAFGENGETYNINADYAAVSVAGALKAEKLLFLTDVEGVLEDVKDSKSVFSHIKADKVKKMIEDGTISGGMIPKVQCCIAGLDAGVEHVHILDGRVKHCLILEVFTDKGIGTLIEN